jgi:hypothetical protein
MGSSPKPRDEQEEGRSNKDAVWELIRTLVLGNATAEEILEIYYWSRDPQILQLLRCITLLSEDDRRQVVEFFSESDPKDVSAKSQKSPRRLVLTA